MRAAELFDIGRIVVPEHAHRARRIIAVCDAYDAMAAPRPYAGPRTTSNDLRLRRRAAARFDPVVVDASSATRAGLHPEPVGVSSA